MSVASLLENSNHKCWKEETPVFTAGVALISSGKVNTSGKFTRGEETLVYHIRFDLKLIYVRYSGDPRFVSTWQCATILQDRNRQTPAYCECPWCGCNIRNLYIWKRTLRCKNCLDLRSRVVAQHGKTRNLVKQIKRGELDKVAAHLKAGGSRAFAAIMAMEQAGLTEVKFTGNVILEWDHQLDCH